MSAEDPAFSARIGAAGAFLSPPGLLAVFGGELMGHTSGVWQPVARALARLSLNRPGPQQSPGGPGPIQLLCQHLGALGPESCPGTNSRCPPHPGRTTPTPLGGACPLRQPQLGPPRATPHPLHPQPCCLIQAHVVLPVPLFYIWLSFCFLYLLFCILLFCESPVSFSWFLSPFLFLPVGLLLSLGLCVSSGLSIGLSLPLLFSGVSAIPIPYPYPPASFFFFFLICFSLLVSVLLGLFPFLSLCISVFLCVSVSTSLSLWLALLSLCVTILSPGLLPTGCPALPRGCGLGRLPGAHGRRAG